MVKHDCPICNPSKNRFSKMDGRWFSVAITSSVLTDGVQNEIVSLDGLDVASELANTKAWWDAFQKIDGSYMDNHEKIYSEGRKRKLACSLPGCHRKLKSKVHDILKSVRETQLAWLDSKIGHSDIDVPRPFTPIIVDPRNRRLDILGRRITLGENGIPAQYTSFFSGSNTGILENNGRDAFAAPPRFECVDGGKILEWQSRTFTFTKITNTMVKWTAKSVSGALELTVTGNLEFDGKLEMQTTFSSQSKNTVLDDIRFVVPWAKDIAKYSMGFGMQGGNCPNTYSWMWAWEFFTHQDAVWLGDVNIGAMLRFERNYEPSMEIDPRGMGGARINKQNGETTLTVFSGPKELLCDSNNRSRRFLFNIDWYFTPFKNLDTRKHFSDRYYHIRQGECIAADVLKKTGVNVISIDRNNRDFNDAPATYLSDIIKKAHDVGIRGEAYYGPHFLTVGPFEIGTSQRPGYKFYMDYGMGRPYLPPPPNIRNDNKDICYYSEQQGAIHKDISSTREKSTNREKYDDTLGNLFALGARQHNSVWDNFFLENLKSLVYKIGVDGVCIDHTTATRKSMQRARRILHMDGNTCRPIDMHLFNQQDENIVFMEFFPYYDQLLYDENSNSYHAPESMLLEMSGIPYGLMSEILVFRNVWQCLLFGMTCGWVSGDAAPAVWKLLDQFGIADAEYFGWWDPACPVKCAKSMVKASAYRKEGKTMIVLASWASIEEKVMLEIDWKALGLDPNKTTLMAPYSAGLQEERVFTANMTIPVISDMGWLLVAGENEFTETPLPLPQ